MIIKRVFLLFLRAAQMVEDQVSRVIVDQAKTELKNGIEKTCE